MAASTAIARPVRSGRLAWLGYAGVLLLGVCLDLACRFFPAQLPFWMPWEFSWPEYLVTTLALSWFMLGLKRLPRNAHPPVWRTISFLLGVVMTYGVLQTH